MGHISDPCGKPFLTVTFAIGTKKGSRVNKRGSIYVPFSNQFLTVPIIGYSNSSKTNRKK